MTNNIIKLFSHYKFIIFLNYIIFASSLFFFYYYFSFGFDVTDESSYFLTSLKSEYSTNIHNFDLFFKKHFELTEYNLKVFRFTNLILIALSNMILCFETLRYLKKKYYFDDSIILSILLIFLLTSVSLYYWEWLPTPSYNTYNLIFCTLLSANLLNHNCKNIFLLFFKILISSFLTAMIFFSKPTSGLSIILIYLLLILFLFKNKVFHIFYFIFLLFFFFLITKYYYEKSLLEFLLKFKKSIELISLKEMHNTYASIISNFTDFIKQTIKQFVFIFFIALSFFYRHKKIKIINLILYLYFLIILLFGSKTSWPTLMIIFNFYLFVINRKFISHKEGLIPMMISFAFVIGTANFFTLQILISLNLLFCTFIIFSSHRKIFLIVLILIMNIKLYIGIQKNLDQPYRLSSALIQQDVSADLYFDGNKFKINTDDKTKEFIENFRKVFLRKNLNYDKNFFIIDMTGALPLVNLITPSKVLEPWIGGGTDGSNKLMYQLIKVMKKDDLENSFFVFSDNSRSIPIDILDNFKIKLDLITSIAPPSYLNNNIRIYKVKKSYE